MNFLKRKFEADKVRETLSANKLPVDESIFCSALSNGRAKKFDELSNEEMKDLKRMIAGLTYSQLLNGLYSVAYELKVITSKEVTETNDVKILEFLRRFEVINNKNQAKLNNPRGDIITFHTPFKKQSYYAISHIAQLIGEVYLIRSAVVN